MEILRWKTRLSVLWVLMAVGTAAAMFLSLLTPGVIEDVMAGEMEGMELTEGILVVYALFFIIPIVVALLCLTLNGSANRWMNFVLGIIWFLWFIVEIVGHATADETVYIAMWLMIALGLIFSALIAWFAWRWPTEAA